MLVRYFRRYAIEIDASGLTHYARNNKAACNSHIRTNQRVYNEELLCPFCFGKIDMEALPAGLRVSHPVYGIGRVGLSDEVYSDVTFNKDEYRVVANWLLTPVP